MKMSWKKIRRKIRYYDLKILGMMHSRHGIIVTAGTTIACIATIEIHAVLGVVFSVFSMWVKDMAPIYEEIKVEIEDLLDDEPQLAVAEVRNVSE